MFDERAKRIGPSRLHASKSVGRSQDAEVVVHLLDSLVA